MRSGTGRVLSAVAIALVVTAAVTVPMAYQARSARDTGPAPSVVSEPSVPAQVAGAWGALTSRTTGALVALAERRADRWQPRVVMHEA